MEKYQSYANAHSNSQGNNKNYFGTLRRSVFTLTHAATVTKQTLPQTRMELIQKHLFA